ncbi:hypothetical protein ACFY8X_25890 [Streptomyces tanashiensis]|uniref:hypothetical protein n=1 Tax=Streptomyces tanashiensis TaxID=67367 RepID=UPI0036ED4B8A
MAYRWMDHHLGGTAGDGESPRFDVRPERMLQPLWVDRTAIPSALPMRTARTLTIGLPIA